MIALQVTSTVSVMSLPWLLAWVLLFAALVALAVAFPEWRGCRRTRLIASAVLIACALSLSLHAATSKPKPTPQIQVPYPCNTDFYWLYPECWIWH